MTAPTIAAPRSKSEWCVRIGLALAAMGLGYISVTYAFAYIIRGTSPVRAHALAPRDGRITALLSELMSGPKAGRIDRLRSDELARQALRQDATAISAVATLIINAQIRNDSVQARYIFAYANKLSRRDLRTRLWAIEDAVERGDIKNALYQYDIALRTSRLAADLLFPILAVAIADPEIRQALISRLSKEPAWSGPFVMYLADNAQDTISVAALFEGLAKVGNGPPEVSRAVLIRRLTEQGRFDAAWKFYASIMPEISRQKSRNPKFETEVTYPSVFDWVSIENDGIDATFQIEGKQRVFYFTAPPGAGGPVLRQMQVLPPGNYMLESHAADITKSAGNQIYWVLTCIESAEIGRVPVVFDSSMNGKFSGLLHVPKGCSAQYLTLIIRPSLQNEDLTGKIDYVQILPVSPS